MYYNKGKKPERKIKRMFFLGGSRAQRLAEVAKVKIPDPAKGNVPRSYMIEACIKDESVPNNGTLKRMAGFLGGEGN